jgi:hypothetical protein
MSFKVVFFSNCGSCGKSNLHRYPLSEEKMLGKLDSLDGQVITKNLGSFVDEKFQPIECNCEKCYGVKSIFYPKMGVIIDESKDILRDIFKEDGDSVRRNAKRMRLSMEWEKELYSNSEYNCFKCGKQFLRPLPVKNQEPEKICPECRKSP